MRNIIQLTFCLICALVVLTLSSCYEQEGCQNPDAVNYDPLAEVDDNTCDFPNMVINFAPVLQVTDTLTRDSVFTNPDTSMPDTVRVRVIEDRIVRVSFGQQIDLHREDNGYKAQLDAADFSISDMVFTTEKETFEFDTADVLDIDREYIIDELKVADVTDLTFNVSTMNIRMQVDVNRNDEYEANEVVELSCTYNGTPIRVLPDGHIVGSINYELTVGLDLEQFFKLSQLSNPTGITCPSELTNADDIFIFK